jgi:hypothetical protein
MKYVHRNMRYIAHITALILAECASVASASAAVLGAGPLQIAPDAPGLSIGVPRGDAGPLASVLATSLGAPGPLPTITATRDSAPDALNVAPAPVRLAPPPAATPAPSTASSRPATLAPPPVRSVRSPSSPPDPPRLIEEARVEMPVMSRHEAGEPWHLPAGQLVGATLANWGRSAGWTVIWNAPLDWQAPSPTDFDGDFPTVAEAVIHALHNNGADIRARAYDANRTLVVVAGDHFKSGDRP